MGKDILDGSGCLLVFSTQGASNGLTHRHAIHVDQIDSTGVYTTVVSGGEANVFATAANYLSVYKQLFATPAVLSFVGAFPVVGGVVQQLALTPLSTVSSVNGSNGSTPADGAAVLNFSARDTLGNTAFFRAIQPTSANFAPAPRATLSPANTGASYNVYAGYLLGLWAFQGGTSRIVSHAGGKLAGAVYETITLNKRLRRRLGEV